MEKWQCPQYGIKNKAAIAIQCNSNVNQPFRWIKTKPLLLWFQKIMRLFMSLFLCELDFGMYFKQREPCSIIHSVTTLPYYTAFFFLLTVTWVRNWQNMGLCLVKSLTPADGQTKTTSVGTSLPHAAPARLCHCQEEEK